MSPLAATVAPEHSPPLPRSTPLRAALAAWWPGLAFLLLSAVFWICALHAARVRPLWFDELFTWEVARLPDLPAIFRHLHAGMDTHPPLSYWLGHLSMAALGQSPLALRLPSMLGVWLAMVALYAFCSFRRRPQLGLLAAALLVTSPVLDFAVEARPYGLFVGLGAAALALWQRAGQTGKGRSAALGALTVVLLAGPWIHYYALLVVVPLGLGELARRRRTGRWDGPMCAVLLAAALDVVPLALFVRGGAFQFAGTFWAAAGSPLDLCRAYQRLLGPSLAVLVGCGLAALAVCWWPRRRHATGVAQAAFRSEEWAAAGAFASIPLLVWALAKLVTHAFAFKYALVAVPGVLAAGAMALGFVPVPRWTHATALAAALLAPLHLGSIGAGLNGPTRSEISKLDELLDDLTDAHDTIAVFESPLPFLPAFHHAGPDLRERLYYPVDTKASLRRAGNDTFARAMAGLQRHTDTHAVDYAELVARHRRFLVVSQLASSASFWLLPRLLEEQAPTVTLLARSDETAVYLVELGSARASSPLGLPPGLFPQGRR